MESSSSLFFAVLQFLAKEGFVLDVLKIRNNTANINPLYRAVQFFAMTISERNTEKWISYPCAKIYMENHNDTSL